MSIASAIQNAQQKVADAYTAISNKGGTLPATQDLANMPTAIASIPSGGSTGKYQLLQRISDDNNIEIGTVSGFFTDANDIEYAVVCLDAQYRNASTQWCSDRNTVTNMPLYNDSVTAWWYNNEKETATENTQLILDFCTAGGYTSTACSHCRSKSFTINGITYYGQLPNIREVFDIWLHRADIESRDTSASTSTLTNFSSAHSIWSSSQLHSNQGWALGSPGEIYGTTKITYFQACPVLELLNQ